MNIEEKIAEDAVTWARPIIRTQKRSRRQSCRKSIQQGVIEILNGMPEIEMEILSNEIELRGTKI